MKGKVQTVLGPIDPDQLGLTLTHEHLLHDIHPKVFHYPLPANLSFLEGLPMSLDNFGWIQHYPYAFEENKEYSSETVLNAIKEEMHFFKTRGGGTIVDNGSVGIRAKNHPEFLKSVSKEIGIHIVTGTGFYVHDSQSLHVLQLNQEGLENIIRKDLLDGINDTDVKCGVIGEIGCSWPLTDFEKKSLRASASMQVETGSPVIIHPGRDKKAPEEIVRVFQEAGGKVGHTVMSHLERTLHTKEELADFASCGIYSEFDLFGQEVSHFQACEDLDMPSDAQRIDRLLYLVQQGYGDKIVIAHDIHTKHRLMKFGGHGFSHILVNVCPKMLKRGFTDEDVKKILFINPKTWLAFQ